MAKWLKEGKSENEIQEADAEVKKTVENILSDVSKRGDEAVRELSKKFDNYEPENFILTDGTEREGEAHTAYCIPSPCFVFDFKLFYVVV